MYHSSLTVPTRVLDYFFSLSFFLPSTSIPSAYRCSIPCTCVAFPVPEWYSLYPLSTPWTYLPLPLPSLHSIHCTCVAFPVPVWHSLYMWHSHSLYLCGIHCTCVAFPVPVWHSMYLCDIPCTCVAFIVAVWHSWYLCGIPCTCVTFPVPVWHSLYLCGIPCIYVAFPVPVWHSLYLYDIPCTCVTFPVPTFHSFGSSPSSRAWSSSHSSSSTSSSSSSLDDDWDLKDCRPCTRCWYAQNHCPVVSTVMTSPPTNKRSKICPITLLYIYNLSILDEISKFRSGGNREQQNVCLE